VRGLNLLDFDRNRNKDLFLLDKFSDQTEFGGLTDSQLSIKEFYPGVCGRKLLSY
jgi:hypothetical protein